MMTLKERYEKLANSTPNETTIEEVKLLKIDCIKQSDFQYTFFCDLLLADIYTENDNLEEALNISMKNLNVIDGKAFRNIYASFLERIIYIYIKQKKFNLAYKYANIKMNYIDSKNEDEINRWYLETAYIYAELNYKEKALSQLLKIVESSNDDNLLSLVYSNICKLYIDLNNTQKAKESLNNCLELVYRLDDHDGKKYCDYLLAKLYSIDNNYTYAIKTYHDLFKSMKDLSEEYISISLEYINTLIDALEIDEANKVVNKYALYYENSNDLYIKRDYYKCLLKISTYKNKSVKDIVPTYIAKIESLDQKINDELEKAITQSENDSSFEVFSKLKELNTNIEKTIDIISKALISENMRDTLLEYGKSLSQMVFFDEFQLIFYDKTKFYVLPELYSDFHNIISYQYKKERLYERTFSYNLLGNTIFEMMISNQQEISLDVKTNSFLITDLVTQKTLADIHFRSLYAVPLFSSDNLYGAIVYFSNNNDVTDNQNIVLYKIATKMLESKLITLFAQENLRTQKNILQTAVNSLQEGIYYNNPQSNNLILTPQSRDFFNFTDLKISKKSFYEMIDSKDLDNYLNTIQKSIEGNTGYKTNYHLLINSTRKIIEEVATPFLSNDGNVQFYVVALHELQFVSVPTPQNSICLGILKQSDFEKKMQSIIEKTKTIEYKFAFIRFKIKDLNHTTDLDLISSLIENVHSLITDVFLENAYLLSDNSIVTIIENNVDLRFLTNQIDRIITQSEKGLIINERLVNYSLYTSIVRYPRDSYNVNDISQFSLLALDETQKIAVFTDDLYKNYLKKETITNLITMRLSNNGFYLLYLEASDNNSIPYYEVKYNIKGLSWKEDVNDFLDDDIKFEFEKRSFITLLNDIKKIDYNVFINMSLSSLRKLINSKVIKSSDKILYSKIILKINKLDDDYKKTIQFLIDLGFKIFINVKLLSTIDILWLLSGKIDGFIISEAIDPKIRIKVLNLASSMGIYIFANYLFQDFDKIIYRTDKLFDLQSDLK